jgi:hypothetical protein
LHVGDDARAGGSDFVSDLEDFLSGLAHDEVTVCNSAFRGKNHTIFADDSYSSGAG